MLSLDDACTALVKMERDNERFREALQEIANQRLPEEVDDTDPDYESGYVTAIRVARKAINRRRRAP